MVTNSRQAAIALSLFVLLLASGSPAQVHSTGEDSDIVSTELYSPWERAGERVTHNRVLAAKSCFSLLEYRWLCHRGPNMSYGNRIGDNWDILSLNGTQSRMIDIGPAEWSKTIETPYIAPFRALRAGEKRRLVVELWGADGADGMNGDGSAPPPRPKRKSNAGEPVSKQVSSQIESRTGERFDDNYNPLLEARKGHMYAIRVVEGSIDQYYLMRVDDVIRGQKVSLTIRKIPPPSKKAIF